ncbi:MAG: LysR family transcriptional regulator [Neomegalonema sp.]|nr:LysR family transcriptional regulator [Neomegalonema sp.]
MRSLDIQSLRTFILVAETESFTAAADQLGATQSAVSLRIRRLEEMVDNRLLDRTPRFVRITEFGSGFLDEAKRLVAHHDALLARATKRDAIAPIHIGVSDHAAGPRLPEVLRRFRRRAPTAPLRVSIDSSCRLNSAFDARRYDAVIVRSDGAEKGRRLFQDRVVWMAADRAVWRPGEPTPLISVSEPCQLRNEAAAALEAAGHEWFDAFCGGGIAAAQYAIEAGLGIACLDFRNAPSGAVILGPEDGLPELPRPRAQLILRQRGEDEARGRLIDMFADAMVEADSSLAAP